MAKLLYIGEYRLYAEMLNLTEKIRNVANGLGGSDIVYRGVGGKTIGELITTICNGYDTWRGIGRHGDIFATPDVRSAISWGEDNNRVHQQAVSESGEHPCEHWLYPKDTELMKRILNPQKDLTTDEKMEIHKERDNLWENPKVRNSQCNPYRYTAVLVYDRGKLTQNPYEDDRFRVKDRNALLAVLYFGFVREK